MEFEEIPKIMKRYTLEAIMGKCSHYAKQLMTVNGLDILNSDLPHPWELETITLFGLMSTQKNDSHDFEEAYHRRKFIGIINCLRDYQHPKLNVDNVDIEWANRFMMVMGLTQFPVQDDIRYKLYRYDYLFNFNNDKLNLKKTFIETFGIGYKKFQIPGQALYTLYCLENVDPQLLYKIIIHIMSKHDTALRQLVIPHTDFIEKQGEILEGNIDNYHYSFKYFYQYPFIESEDKIYLPLPYLIINAITDSLLYRITDGNNSLRSQIGKNAIESYLLKILKDSAAYDKVFSEQSYKKGGTELMSSDVLTKIDSSCIFFDSKSSVPQITLRNFDDKSYTKAIRIYSEAVVQIYNRIKDFNLYNPFGEDFSNMQQNLFGVIVVLEDNNIHRDIVYKASSEKLNLNKNSPEWKYLRSNITIVPLREIEKFSLQSENILQQLVAKRDNQQKWNDFCFDTSISNDHFTPTNDFDNFLNKSKSYLSEIVEDLAVTGIINK